LNFFCVYWIAVSALVLLAPEVPLHWKAWGKAVFVAVSAISAWISRISGKDEPTEGKTEPRRGPASVLAKYAHQAGSACIYRDLSHRPFRPDQPAAL